MELKIINGDSLEILKTFPDNHFDAVVTDPPYGLSFMNKHWDYDVPTTELWREVLRVLKFGGHVLVACGTRTQHRMAVNVEDAGFEIRDVITWHYGSGFPKSLDVSKAIDKAAGAERKVVGKYVPPNGKEWNLKQAKNPEIEHASGTFTASGNRTLDITSTSTDDAKEWSGWGTALKPSTEFWTLARKPFDGTVAENVLKYGTGGINIDGCRVETSEVITNHSRGEESAISKGKYGDSTAQETHQTEGQKNGRFPANLILSHHTDCVQVGMKKVKGTSTGNGDAEKGEESDNIPLRRGSFTDRTDENGLETVEAWQCHPDCPLKIMDEQSGISKSKSGDPNRGTYKKAMFANSEFNKVGAEYDDMGGASRFFYCAKASKQERNKGLENFEEKLQANANFRPNHLEKALNGDTGKPHGRYSPTANHHPTVKPVKLMQYLVRLITPKGGLCLDPFNGSGTTGIACKLEGVNYIGIEREKEYCDISEARIKAWEGEYDTIESTHESLETAKENEAETTKQLGLF